jgi:hypothetical protein
VIRRHHPLEGQSLELFKDGKEQLVVCLPDGSRIRIPRSWTDLDGDTRTQVAPDLLTVFTVDAVREFSTLVDALKQRS